MSDFDVSYLEKLGEKWNKRNLTDMFWKIEEDLIKDGGDVADDCYASVYYEGEKDYFVYPKLKDLNEGEIRAKGVSVIFLEFGSGVGATHKEGGEFGFVEDSWSSTHAKQYHEKGYWKYNGKMITGQPAAMGLYNARKHILKNAQKKTEEVLFGD